MPDAARMTIGSMLVPQKSIRREITARLDDHSYKKIPKALQGDHEAEGWVFHKALTKDVWMRRRKSHDVAFEDRVWAMFASLNFPNMNADRKFVLPYGAAPNETKQIDVFAADAEVVVVVECKSTEVPARHAFKSEVEAIQGVRGGLIKTIKREYPYHKIKFLLATNNYGLTDNTADRIKVADVVHMDEDTVDYYLDLANYLGKAARFQMLGWLCGGERIPGLNTDVPAIEGKMGGHRYYSFMIEPERLLKLAYVLHRHKANSSLMPTYQRLIKKGRLKKVAEFVDNGGFFPNSLVLNIESGKKDLRFDKKYGEGDEAKLGVLRLPQMFRAAYVIDGQHRLYGYAETEIASTELIPVVAFVDLPREAQSRLFMEINENQKAVPKNLRSTLNANLLWDSDDLAQQAQAMRLRIAEALEDTKTSPLRGRIVLGEDRATNQRCITIEALNQGIDRGRFIGSFKGTLIKDAGSFYRGDRDATFQHLVEFFELCFARLRDGLPGQFTLGKSEGGFVFMNVGVTAFLRVLGDIVDELIAAGDIDPLQQSTSGVYAAVEPYIDIIVQYLNALPRDEAQELRGKFGSSGQVKYWRALQKALADAVPGFEPDGLADYLLDQDKKNNEEAYKIIRDVEQFLKKDVRERLEDRFGANWYKDGVPKKAYLEAVNLATEKNLEKEPGDSDLDWWDCIYLRAYEQIFKQEHALWVELFSEQYSRPEDEGKSGGWKARSDWVARLNKIRNDTDHQYAVKDEDYEFLVELQTWLGL